MTTINTTINKTTLKADKIIWYRIYTLYQSAKKTRKGLKIRQNDNGSF